MLTTQPRTPAAPQKALTKLAEKGILLSDCAERFNLLRKHRSELLAEYPDQWVAIGDNWVFVVADTRASLREQLVKCGAYPPHSVRMRLETNPPRRIPG